MINRTNLPLETEPGKKYRLLTARYKQVLRYLVPVIFLISGLDTKAQTPVANFTANKVSGCAPLVVVFQDQSTGNPKFWNWDLGNGQLSNLQNPTAVYYQPGTYSITLVVRNANGTNGIVKTNYITVFPSPIVNFNVDKTIACMPAVIQFTDLSSDTAGNITKWEWDFGDGSTSLLRNPSHTFSNIGFYTISLKVTSSTGCTAAVGRYRFIRVVSGVTADFTTAIGGVCRAPFGINFLNQTSGPGTLTYNWNFGNGNNSTATNPSTSFATAGNYTITLTAQSEYGCSGTISKPVTLTGATTNFNLPDSACLNKPVNFQNASTPAPVKSKWNFGDGTTSTQINPAKIYTSPGTYNVKLYNSYSYCSDSITKQIRILPPSIVNFTANNQYACKGPFAVSFQDLSPNATGWQWSFGDGGSSTQQNPIHTYLSNGTYNVSLTITTAFGCSSTLSKTQFIKILKPVLNITNIPIGGCIPFTFSPIPDVTALDGVANYSWNFGDGNSATGQYPNHTYIDSGTYKLKLVVTTNGGCTDSLEVPDAVRVGPVPFVDFKSDVTTTCAFNTITFTDLSNPADAWQWDFGDGQKTTDRNPVHAYTDSGYFSVTLTAFNNGCPNSVTKPQLVKINPPIADFADTIMNCNQKQTVTFINKSKTDPGYGPITYLWQFGDPANSTSNAVNPVFTYPSLGTYTITLTVTNGACSNSIGYTLELVSEAADFRANKTAACKNEIITISATNSDSVNISQYEWSINGGPPFIGERSFQTSFPNSGSYSVQLTVTDNKGCITTKAINNYISVSGPSANFTAVDSGGCKNSNILLTDLSQPNGGVSEWEWEFGDGQILVTHNAGSVTHRYTDTGFFNIKLTVMDNNGCADGFAKVNFIQITSPKADFYSSNTLFCAGALLPFKDSSAGYITDYAWTFGDGGSSNLQNPTHAYSGQDSAYTVTLVVRDAVGCMDSVSKVDYIQIKSPKPAFDAIDTAAICPPLETKFTLRARDYESFYWDFGDGQTSTLDNPKHFYNAYGNYTAKLYVAGYGGCVDSAVRNVNVFNPYTTAINYSPLDACNELTVNFNIAPPANTKCYFYFGDGLVDSSQAISFSHSYKSPSFYSPYMIIKDSLDCQATVGGPSVVKVYGAEPFFGVDKKAFCDSGTVYFTNYTITNDTVLSSIWDFGDGSTSTAKDPIHTFSNPGSYYVSLSAATTRGCSKTLYDTIKVSGTPQPIISSTNVVCINSNIDFGGSLAVADTSIKWNWTLGNGQSSSQQNTNTTYNGLGNPAITLEAANYLGCKRSVTKNVSVVPLPKINIIEDPTIISGVGIVIPTTFTNNVVSYNWTPTKYLSCIDCANPYCKPQFTTTYKVNVVDSNGCTASRDVTVTVICNNMNYFIPNTFSPNGDGMNDVFYPRGSGINRIQSLRIFNRWGEMLYEKKDFAANDPSAGWNGTVRGKPADQDVYVYVIEFICENAAIIPYRGNVALIR